MVIIYLHIAYEANACAADLGTFATEKPRLNSYNKELLPRLSLCERLDTGVHERKRLTARSQRPAGQACEHKALRASRMHLHDKPCLLHTALSF